MFARKLVPACLAVSCVCVGCGGEAPTPRANSALASLWGGDWSCDLTIADHGITFAKSSFHTFTSSDDYDVVVYDTENGAIDDAWTSPCVFFSLSATHAQAYGEPAECPGDVLTMVDEGIDVSEDGNTLTVWETALDPTDSPPQASFEADCTRTAPASPPPAPAPPSSGSDGENRGTECITDSECGDCGSCDWGYCNICPIGVLGICTC